MKGKLKIFVYILIIFSCISILFFSSKTESDFIQVVSMLSAILGVVLLALEMYQSRKISEADFLSELNSSFVTNEDYKTAYILFENYDFENLPDIEMDNVQISNYLTFFEIFQLLIDRGTLTIEMLNDLFGYRFFIAVHNPYVQKRKLVKSPENFRNLYLLEKKWVEYRRKKNLPIFHEEYCLENVVDADTYKRIISRKNK